MHCGLTEAMVGSLLDGSFKKQIKLFVRQYKEGETIVTLEPVPVELYQSTELFQLQPSTDPG